MKKILPFLFLALITQVQAQEVTEIDSTITIIQGDTTRIKLGRYNLTIIEKEGEKDEFKFYKEFDEFDEFDEEYGSDWPTETPKKPEGIGSKERKRLLTHWNGMTFGINGYIGDNMSLDLPNETNYMEVDYSSSFTYNINYPELKVRIIKDYVGIYTGLGLQFNSYRLRQDVTLKFNDEVSHFTDTTKSLTRNTLQMYYVRAPLMLEFNTSSNPLKTFHFAVGVVGGFRLTSAYRQNYLEDGMKYVTHTKKIKNLNLFTGEAMVRVGYSHFVMYASYWLTPLFTKDEGPELYPVNVGLGFSF